MAENNDSMWDLKRVSILFSFSEYLFSQLRKMRLVLKPALLLVALFSFLLQPLLAMAVIENVKLKQLRVQDVIYLPTVTSQRTLMFTKPKTWQLSASSHLEVAFQHSWELDPSRSWLQVIVNNRILKQVALGPDNAKNTILSVPLPVGILKEQNTVTFRVQQHYKAACEDPLDPSLWTQILPESKLVFDYTPVLPSVDLAQYPFPVVDPLTYSPQPLQYIVPNAPTDKEVQALGYLNMHLAQASGAKEVRTKLSHPGSAIDGKSHLIYVGTPSDNAGVAQYQGMIQQKQLSGDSGLILYFAHPTFKERAVVVVTGNTPDGVLQAAKYLTSKPFEGGLKGQAVVVPENWNPSAGESSRVTRFIENQSRSLKDLGYGEEAVEKIYAPPITYQVPVLADYLNSNANLWLDLSYSYGRKGGDLINPKFSSLEIRLNDMPIANVPLLESENGESMAKASIPLPKDLIKPSNTLVAQYHLLPDKFGWCKDDYQDKAWGKVHDNTNFRVEGSPASLLPNAGVLNYTGFPYSRDANYKNTHFILPAKPGDGALQTFLGITSRLGRATFTDTDLRFTLSLGDNIPYKTKDLIVVQDLRQPLSLPPGGKLSWTGASPLMRQFALQYPDAKETHKLDSYETGAGSYIEQYLPNWNNQLVVTVLAAMNDKGFQDLSLLFEDDDKFAKLTPGPMKLLSETTGDINTVQGMAARTEKTGAAASINWWSWLTMLSWPMMIAIAVVLAIILILLPIFLRRINQRY